MLTDGRAQCLSLLDDGRHRHHRLLLLQHLARLSARSTFTRHRGPIYFPDLFTHTHTHTTTPSPWHNHPAWPLDLFRFFSDGTFASSAPRHLAKEVPCLPPCPALPRPSSLALLLLVSIWYGCSLHFFGSFVRDRSRDRLLNYSTVEREEWQFQKQEGITTDAKLRKNPSPNRTAALNPTAFTDK